MIYLVTTSPFPYGFAATKRVQLLAEGMNMEIKCQVVVCTRVATKSLQEKNKDSRGRFGGIDYIYTTKSVYSSPSFIRRKIDEILDVNDTCRYLDAKLKQEDVVYLFMRDNYAERRLIRVAHRHNCLCYRELCELPYVTGKDNLFMRLQRRISLNCVLPKYDGIVAISEALEEIAKKYCKPSTRIVRVPILIKTGDADSEERRTNEENINLFHAGTLTQQKDGIITIFKAIGELKTRYGIEFPYYLTGNISSSPDASDLNEIIDRYKLSKIHFLGYISDEDVERRIKESTFLILYKTNNLQNKYCFATKLGEYLKEGKIVVTTDFGEQAKYLTDKDNCLMVKEGDLDSLVEAIKWIIDNKKDLSLIQKRAAKTCIDSFDYIKNTKKIIKTILG